MSLQGWVLDKRKFSAGAKLLIQRPRSYDTASGLLYHSSRNVVYEDMYFTISLHFTKETISAHAASIQVSVLVPSMYDD